MGSVRWWPQCSTRIDRTKLEPARRTRLDIEAEARRMLGNTSPVPPEQGGYESSSSILQSAEPYPPCWAFGRHSRCDQGETVYRGEPLALVNLGALGVITAVCSATLPEPSSPSAKRAILTVKRKKTYNLRWRACKLLK